MSWAFYGLCYVHSLIQYSNAPLEVAGVILSLHRRWSLGNSRTNSDPTRSITLIQELGNSSFPCGVAVQKAHETECTKGAPWSYIWGRLYSNWKRYMYPNVQCSTIYSSMFFWFWYSLEFCTAAFIYESVDTYLHPCYLFSADVFCLMMLLLVGVFFVTGILLYISGFLLW